MQALRKKDFINVTINIAAWIIFFMLPFVFLPYNPKFSPLQSERFVSSLIASNGLLIIFYYFNKLWLIPRILANKRIWLYILVVVVSFLLYLSVLYFIYRYSQETKDFLMQRNPKFRPWKPKFFQPGPVVLFLLAFIISGGSEILSTWFKAEKIKEEASMQQLETELSLLKSQVNPHFLFNTLNSIYMLAIANNENTADAVMKLSRIMRYTLEESQKNQVSLNAEIEFIKSYIDLQKLRLTENVQVNFDIQGNTDTVSIAPLLFMPFVENAFKYGVSTHKPSAIQMSMQVKGNTLAFNCSNSVISVNHHEGIGIGILNTQRRLELLYPGKYVLDIKNENQQYQVLLNITI